MRSTKNVVVLLGVGVLVTGLCAIYMASKSHIDVHFLFGLYAPTESVMTVGCVLAVVGAVAGTWGLLKR